MKFLKKDNSKNNSPIEKQININGKEISAAYFPESGWFHFEKSKANSDTDDLTNAGAFRTMRALIENFKEINPYKIKYEAHGITKKTAETRDKLYARELSRLGYTQKYSSGKFQKDECYGGWTGPKKIWIRKGKDSYLERATATASILSLISGAFFYSTKLTGNVVGVSTQTSSLIGVCLLIVGLLAGFFYLKNKKK